jgi:hypothetical protein
MLPGLVLHFLLPESDDTVFAKRYLDQFPTHSALVIQDTLQCFRLIARYLVQGALACFGAVVYKGTESFSRVFGDFVFKFFHGRLVLLFFYAFLPDRGRGWPQSAD